MFWYYRLLLMSVLMCFVSMWLIGVSGLRVFSVDVRSLCRSNLYVTAYVACMFGVCECARAYVRLWWPSDQHVGAKESFSCISVALKLLQNLDAQTAATHVLACVPFCLCVCARLFFCLKVEGKCSSGWTHTKAEALKFVVMCITVSKSLFTTTGVNRLEVLLWIKFYICFHCLTCF